MNRSAMFPARPLAAALALALLAACGGGEAGGSAEAPLAGTTIGGPFELVNSRGETVRWSDFEGRYRMVYFGYAYCPDVCPTDVQKMMQGYNAFSEANPQLAGQVQPLFITIDPERDTPQVVGQFTEAFSDDLIGLTGTPEQIAAAAEAFAVYYSKAEDGGAGGYLMGHSNYAFLMGRKGEPIAFLPIDQSADAVAKELGRWVS